MRIENLLAFLQQKQWTKKSENETTIVFFPPTQLGCPDDYWFPVPKTVNNDSDKRFVENLINLLADLYFIDIQILTKQLHQLSFSESFGEPTKKSIDWLKYQKLYQNPNLQNLTPDIQIR